MNPVFRRLHLEPVHPMPALYPSSPVDRAQALSLEKYADTKWVEVVLPVLRERFVNKKFFQKEPDEAIVKETLEVAIPLAFDYLEGRIDVKVFMIGTEFSVADIAVVSPFVNFGMGGETVDAGRWPPRAFCLWFV